MARNWMGDYDPGNTTGWKQKGQIETRKADGSTETSYDKSSNNPNYDPQAKRAVPVTVNPKGFNKAKNWASNKIQNWNHNARTKYIQRILKRRMERINAGLKESGVDFFGDTKENYGDFIKNYGKSITAYGPEGTGLYSQKMIDDVISGKRVAPEFFTKIDPSGGMWGSAAAAVGNTIGPLMAGPVTKERLNELYKEYEDIKKIDPNTMNVKQMMEIYEPNRYKTLYGDDQPSGDAYPQILPIDYNTGAGTVDERETQTFEFDPTRFGGGAKSADVTRASYIFNQGGRVPRAFGGIMNTRQAYGLGDIVKSFTKPFKSVAKAAGKVLKSDWGKAALGIGAFMYGPKLFGATKWGGFGGWDQAIPKSGFMSKLLRKNIAEKGQDFIAGGLDPWKIGGMALTALPFLGIGNKGEQDASLIGDRGGRLPNYITGGTGTPAELRASIDSAVEEAAGDPIKLAAINQKYNYMLNLGLPDNLPYPNYSKYANGGRIKAEEGGLMNLGGMEKDYRNEGGFVPIGRAEKADDVPARLSVNEFVFTADAVRNAGGGDIDKGAEVMENMMKNLENGGRISEESQGNTGAQEMFSVSERIGEVI